MSTQTVLYNASTCCSCGGRRQRGGWKEQLRLEAAAAQERHTRAQHVIPLRRRRQWAGHHQHVGRVGLQHETWHKEQLRLSTWNLYIYGKIDQEARTLDK